jgi:hypothetical protein
VSVWLLVDRERSLLRSRPGGHELLRELNDIVEFDSPFNVDENGDVVTELTRVDAVASAELLEDGTLWLDGLDAGEHPLWRPVNGWSQQYGYRGPVMHASELLAGEMARELLRTPGTYSLTAVSSPESEGDDTAGWLLLQHRAPEHTREAT